MIHKASSHNRYGNSLCTGAFSLSTCPDTQGIGHELKVPAPVTFSLALGSWGDSPLLSSPPSPNTDCKEGTQHDTQQNETVREGEAMGGILK